MEECKQHKGVVDEIKSFHLDIIDRLARIETKQDNTSGLNGIYQNELTQLHAVAIEQGKTIAALDQEIKNLKWLAGVVAGIVAGVIQFLSFLWKRG